MNREQSRTVGIFIFDDVEVLDFCGPFEVFSVARTPGDDSNEPNLFRPITIAEDEGIVRCVGGLTVEPHFTITNHPPLDIILIPGGRGTRRVRLNPRVLQWIEKQYTMTELTLSVCTGAFLLAEGGILNGLRATTYWDSVAALRQGYPDVDVRDDTRYVDEGKVVTSAGVSAGIDMSLHIVARLHGDDAATWTARRMEYTYWTGDGPASHG